MRTTYFTALVIANALAAWLVSGQWNSSELPEHTTLAEQNRESTVKSEDRTPTRVRARVIHAEPQFQQVLVRGKTENKRTVQVRSEIAGRVVERPVERGTVVDEGDLLCRVSVDDRIAGLTEAQEALRQARIEYQGSLELKEKGFQSETAIAQTRARLASAQAQVKRRQLDVERTRIRAPFSGIVEDLHQNVGDYLTPGAGCVTLVDLDPMLLIGRVSERDVLNVTLAQTATGKLSDGRTVSGPITFIGQQSDPATRTYAIEVQIPNSDFMLRSGITTEFSIPVNEVMAQKISPSLFALDDEGQIGVRTINERSVVEFYIVDMVRDDHDGVWVSGLPEVTTLITVGQELVMPGETVEIEFEASLEMHAEAPPPQSSLSRTLSVETPLGPYTGH